MIRRCARIGVVLNVLLMPAWAAAADDKDPKKAPVVYPTAILAFEERGAGAKDMAAKVTDILFAKLAARDELHLVDRDDLKKTLAEQELNLSGAVKAGEATKVGQLTGAKLIVTGSVIHADKRLVLVAKVIGTETSRVIGTSVDGKVGDELAGLVEKLAEKVGDTIARQSDKLVAKVVSRGDRVAALQKELKKVRRPVLFIQIAERHVGAPTIDPAAQTELGLFARETGFELIDPDQGMKSKADIIITGEGLSEFAGRHGALVTVKARVEVRAIDRKTDKLIAVDRQTAVTVDLSEQLAGKAALQQAAAALAERLLPKLVSE